MWPNQIFSFFLLITLNYTLAYEYEWPPVGSFIVEEVNPAGYYISEPLTFQDAVTHCQETAEASLASPLRDENFTDLAIYEYLYNRYNIQQYWTNAVKVRHESGRGIGIWRFDQGNGSVVGGVSPFRYADEKATCLTYPYMERKYDHYYLPEKCSDKLRVICPGPVIHGNWGPWSAGTPSNGTCAEGTLFPAVLRRRECNMPESFNGDDCIGDDTFLDCRMIGDICPCYNSSYATASSIYQGRVEQYGPQRAFDKLISYNSLNFWHTSGGSINEWIQIDLQLPTIVYRVAIIGRMGLLNRFFSYEARVGNMVTEGAAQVIDYNTPCGTTMPAQYTDARNYYFDCSEGIQGRYITLRRTTAGGFKHLNEIYIDNRPEIPAEDDYWRALRCLYFDVSSSDSEMEAGMADHMFGCLDNCNNNSSCTFFSFKDGNCKLYNGNLASTLTYEVHSYAGNKNAPC